MNDTATHTDSLLLAQEVVDMIRQLGARAETVIVHDADQANPSVTVTIGGGSLDDRGTVAAQVADRYQLREVFPWNPDCYFSGHVQGVYLSIDAQRFKP